MSLSLLALLGGLMAFFFGTGLMFSSSSRFVGADVSYRAIFLAFGGEGSLTGEHGSALLKIAFIGLLLGFLCYCFAVSAVLAGGKKGPLLSYAGSGISFVTAILFLCGGTVASLDGYASYLSDGFVLPAVFGFFAALSYPAYRLAVKYGKTEEAEAEVATNE